MCKGGRGNIKQYRKMRKKWNGKGGKKGNGIQKKNGMGKWIGKGKRGVVKGKNDLGRSGKQK